MLAVRKLASRGVRTTATAGMPVATPMQSAAQNTLISFSMQPLHGEGQGALSPECIIAGAPWFAIGMANVALGAKNSAAQSSAIKA